MPSPFSSVSISLGVFLVLAYHHSITGQVLGLLSLLAGIVMFSWEHGLFKPERKRRDYTSPVSDLAEAPEGPLGRTRD